MSLWLNVALGSVRKDEQLFQGTEAVDAEKLWGQGTLKKYRIKKRETYIYLIYIKLRKEQSKVNRNIYTTHIVGRGQGSGYKPTPKHVQNNLYTATPSKGALLLPSPQGQGTEQLPQEAGSAGPELAE